MGSYGCRGYLSAGPFKLFGGVAKGHPDESDINGAVEFLKGSLELPIKLATWRRALVSEIFTLKWDQGSSF